MSRWNTLNNSFQTRYILEIPPRWDNKAQRVVYNTTNMRYNHCTALVRGWRVQISRTTGPSWPLKIADENVNPRAKTHFIRGLPNICHLCTDTLLHTHTHSATVCCPVCWELKWTPTQSKRIYSQSPHFQLCKLCESPSENQYRAWAPCHPARPRGRG